MCILFSGGRGLDCGLPRPHDLDGHERDDLDDQPGDVDRLSRCG